MMNMRSSGDYAPQARSDDRTVRARLRDAAIEVVAAGGLEALTARAVADRAGTSPGSVINNFGSMAGLRLACDDHVAAIVREQKLEVMRTGSSLDLLGALRGIDAGPLVAYLAAVLAEDSVALAHLVDELVDGALAYLEAGVESGMIQPSQDPRGRAVVLTLLSMGALVMHRHLRRLLDVDLTTADPDPTDWGAYIAPLYELYAGGLFTPEFARQAVSAMTELRSDPSRRVTQDSGSEARGKEDDE
jgi:AcrR family transcriptional regulator